MDLSSRNPDFERMLRHGAPTPNGPPPMAQGIQAAAFMQVGQVYRFCMTSGSVVEAKVNEILMMVVPGLSLMDPNGGRTMMNWAIPICIEVEDKHSPSGASMLNWGAIQSWTGMTPPTEEKVETN